MSSSGRSGSVGCAKVFGWGCGGCVLLLVIGSLGIFASWDLLKESGPFRRVTETFQGVKGQVEAVNALRQSLVADYPAEDLRADFQIVTRDGVTTKTLRVVVLNPRFEVPDDAEGKRAVAREIAGAVAARFADLRRYDRVRIELRTGSADDFASSVSSFEFPTAEL